MLMVGGAADARNLNQATWRCGKMIIKHEELDLVLKSCDHKSTPLLMLKWQKQKPWMRPMHISVETLWLNTHLL